MKRLLSKLILLMILYLMMISLIRIRTVEADNSEPHMEKTESLNSYGNWSLVWEYKADYVIKKGVSII